MQSNEECLSLLESGIKECEAELFERGYSKDSPAKFWDIQRDKKLVTKAENVFRQAVIYAASLIPRDIAFIHVLGTSPMSWSGHVKRKNLLINWLDLFRPLMDYPRNIERNSGIDNPLYSHTDALIREIRMLLAGEESALFQPVDRKSGQRQNAYTEAENKFRALAHEKRLRASGKTAGEAQAIICEAFGPPWSTIAGWKKQCERSLGLIFVEVELERAKQKISPENLDEFINISVRIDGDAYKRRVQPTQTQLYRSDPSKARQAAKLSES